MSDADHADHADDDGPASAEPTSAAEPPQPEPAKTDHPTGDDQAAQNRETESPA